VDDNLHSSICRGLRNLSSNFANTSTGSNLIGSKRFFDVKGIALVVIRMSLSFDRFFLGTVWLLLGGRIRQDFWARGLRNNVPKLRITY
jgi:hypothetical protein